MIELIMTTTTPTTTTTFIYNVWNAAATAAEKTLSESWDVSHSPSERKKHVIFLSKPHIVSIIITAAILPFINFQLNTYKYSVGLSKRQLTFLSIVLYLTTGLLHYLTVVYTNSELQQSVCTTLTNKHSF